jgi:hypothetical protein
MVSQELANVLTVFERWEDLRGHLGPKIRQNVGRIVGLEMVQQLGKPFGVGLIQKFCAKCIVELSQRKSRFLGWKPVEEPLGIIHRQMAQQARQIGRIEVGRKVHDHTSLPRLEEGGDVIHQLGIDLQEAPGIFFACGDGRFIHAGRW